MRVISGTAKGHRLIAPKSNQTRPVLDQVKEAIFNILFNVTDLHVLDLFAGSGAIGIEALSRGAKCCTFVECAKPALTCIHKNITHCKVSSNSHILALPAHRSIERLCALGQSFDLIFVDPPYLKDLVNPTLQQLATSSLLHTDTTIIIEHHPKEPIDMNALPNLSLTNMRKYGQTHITFLAVL